MENIELAFLNVYLSGYGEKYLYLLEKLKIEFFSNYNNKVNIDVLESKIQAMYDHYHRCKYSLLNLLQYYIQ